MSFSVYPNAPAKLNKKDSMSQMLKRFFPSVEEDAKENEKSITVKAKVLPGLKRNEDKTQKFNIRDLVLNIQQKGFTLEDSVEAVNDALTRLKMESTKKSPFPDIEYDDYIKQVEDEILAHIVQGDEFRNIGNIAEFLYIGDNDELLGDGGYDKDNKLRDYLKDINELIKDEKFYLNNHSEDHNAHQAIKSSIYLLKHLIKEYRRNDTPPSGLPGDTIGVAADNVIIEDLVNLLDELFKKDLSLFFLRDTGNYNLPSRATVKPYNITLREEYQDLRDYITREDDFQNFLYDNFSNTVSSFSYIVVLDEDIEGVETAMSDSMDSIIKSMKNHNATSAFSDMDRYIRNNPNCNKSKKSMKETVIEEGKDEEKKNKKKELEEKIKISFEDSKERSTIFKDYLNIHKIPFNSIDDVFKSNNYPNIKDALSNAKNISTKGFTEEEKENINEYLKLMHPRYTSSSKLFDPELYNGKFPENPDEKEFTLFLLKYLNQIKYKLMCILKGSTFLEERIKFDLEGFDTVFNDVYKRINSSNLGIKEYLGMINLLVNQMANIYRVVNNFWIELEHPELNKANQKKPMTRYQVSKKISSMSGLKDQYDDLEKTIKIDFKLYNKRYMLNFQSGYNNEELNKEYKDKYEEYKKIKERLDEQLYKEGNPGHLKDEFKLQAKITPINQT